MPLQKTRFTIPFENLQEAIDVNDSAGRSVPINMNFVDEGYLTKDTGIELFGAADMALRHSLFHYKKKDGTSHILSVMGTKLQEYIAGVWVDIAPATLRTVTITIATPGVITLAKHGLPVNTAIKFSTTGTLPTGLVAGTTYYVISAGLTANTFQVSATLAGAAVNTSGTQSGIHSLQGVTTWVNTYTANAELAFYVYNDICYGSNAVEDYFQYDGYTVISYPNAPKGNALEIFEDRMFVTGVIVEPLTYYYSDVGDPTNFPAANLVKPLGTDQARTMKNYYGTLLMFKVSSIWKLTFEYDQVLADFVPKIVLQSDDYGACSRKAVTTVENDLWFFTGREVRAIGFQDNQIGVFGVNRSVISEPIKETLKLITYARFDKCATFYENRRFYLAIPLDADTADTTFVCHTLYANSWTKYTGRAKARINDFMVIDDDIYTTTSSAAFGCIKWTSSLNDIDEAIASSVLFKRVEDEAFDRFRIYRYLDVLFKDLQGVVTGLIRSEANNGVTVKSKQFYVGNVEEDQNNTTGEVPFGQDLFGDAFGEDMEASPFVKDKISFLSKAQAILIGFSNARLDETFSIAKYQLSGYEQPKKMFDPARIISIK